MALRWLQRKGRTRRPNDAMAVAEAQAEDNMRSGLRPASRAHIALEAAVLAALEAEIWPETILEIVGEALEESSRNGLVPSRGATHQ